jgi:hypothetical protein
MSPVKGQWAESRGRGRDLSERVQCFNFTQEDVYRSRAFAPEHEER